MIRWLKDIFYRFSLKVVRQPALRKYENQVASGVLVIGEGTYGIPDVEVYKGSEARVIIGKYCSIAGGVKMITGGNHTIDTVSQYPFRIMNGLPGAYEDGNPYTKGDIVIGNDVWISTGSTVLSGVTIGDGAIISSGSIVTGDIPPYTIAGGIPAKVIRNRFTPEQAEALLKIKWWEWDKQKILDHVPQLASGDIDSFIQQHLKDQH